MFCLSVLKVDFQNYNYRDLFVNDDIVFLQTNMIPMTNNEILKSFQVGRC